MTSLGLAMLLLFALIALAWIFARVFRGGAPTGESSARADTYATGAGYRAEDLDTLRSEARREHE